MNRQASTRMDLERMLLDKAKEPMPLQLALLQDITDNFSSHHEIGFGGFAVVYKGILENGTVAVKKLTNAHSMHESKLQQEIQCLLKVKHRNVIRFLGYCCDTQGLMASHNGQFLMADIQERLLCFEYLPKGTLTKYISDASGGLDWRDRYTIIKGICVGLDYLHKNNIVHLDLKPDNILMDEKMVPKIADFGLSRCFKEQQTHTFATKIAGSLGYLAPEFSEHKITHKYDLYALGVIITEIITGARGYHDVEEVLEKWNKRLDRSQREQVRVCSELASQCTEYNPRKRPTSTQYVVDRLTETESTEALELLSVYLVELRFPFEPSTEEYVVFRLTNRSEKSWRCFASLPLHSVVPSRSTYTLVVTTKHQERLPEETDYQLVLQSSLLGDKNALAFRDQSKYDQLFEEEEVSGNAVHEAILTSVFSSQGQTASKNQRILSVKNTHGMLCSLDAQSTEPCIITGHQQGDVCVWNYDTQKGIDSFKVWKESVMPSYLPRKVHSVKVISRKQWFVAGTSDGVIHVYSYDTKMQKLRSFRAASDGFITSIAVHSESPYVLTSAHRDLKLWDWTKGWECTQSFMQEHTDTIGQVMFNPMDTDVFASASHDHTVKVWSIGSPESNFTLIGHSDKVNCLDFFICDNKQYLITGSDDHTAKIWDMEEKACVRTMEAYMSPVISVLALPDSPYLLTGSKDGCLHFWSSSEFRLERIINFGSNGAIWGLGRLVGSRRIVIGQEYAISIMDINDEEPVPGEESIENSM